MKIFIVFDSFFGNTEKVARAMGEALGQKDQVELQRVADVQPSQLKDFDLLIVGSPTRAFSPSPGIKQFISKIPKSSLEGRRVAAFDTRIAPEDVNNGFLSFMMRLFGYAAKPIANKLHKKGGTLVSPPEGFIVKESEGPLREGELERAAEWAGKFV
ncbi:flavodoxin family protein [bacterium]|nr:flavodoxin family protein [bacterium]